MNGIKREYFEKIDSTNEYAKARRSAGEDLIVVAKTQTGGRGTKGRSFSSNEGGLYYTKLTFYKALPATRAFLIMQTAAAAVCETLAFFGLQAKIKWPNDIFVGGKKICGILIENTFSGAFVSSSVVGIGLNIYNSLPEDLREIATTAFERTGKRLSLLEVERVLTENLCREETAEKYARYLGWIREEVILIVGEKRVRATVLGVDETGGLIARTADGEKRFSAGEISLRTEV